MAKNKIFLFFLFVTSRVSSLHMNGKLPGMDDVCVYTDCFYLFTVSRNTHPSSKFQQCRHYIVSSSSCSLAEDRLQRKNSQQQQQGSRGKYSLAC